MFHTRGAFGPPLPACACLAHSLTAVAMHVHVTCVPLQEQSNARMQHDYSGSLQLEYAYEFSCVVLQVGRLSSFPDACTPLGLVGGFALAAAPSQPDATGRQHRRMGTKQRISLLCASSSLS